MLGGACSLVRLWLCGSPDLEVDGDAEMMVMLSGRDDGYAFGCNEDDGEYEDDAFEWGITMAMKMIIMLSADRN